MNSKQWITAPTCSNQFVSVNMRCTDSYLSELLNTLLLTYWQKIEGYITTMNLIFWKDMKLLLA